MHLTSDQTQIMALLEKTQMLYTRQVHRLLLLDTPNKKPYQTETALRQLQYLGRIRFRGEDLICLPVLQTAEVDATMLKCVDIMLEVAKSAPISVAADRRPFRLSFLLEGGDGYAAFAIAAVPLGQESAISRLVSHAACGDFTIIFLIEDRSQRQLIPCDATHFFALQEGDGYRYYKGGDTA